jgi:hypothetical protein
LCVRIPRGGSRDREQATHEQQALPDETRSIRHRAAPARLSNQNAVWERTDAPVAVIDAVKYTRRLRSEPGVAGSFSTTKNGTLERPPVTAR